jgi:hypothetical protein
MRLPIYLNIRQEFGAGLCLIITHKVCAHVYVCVHAREGEGRGTGSVYVVCHSVMMATVCQNIGLRF